MMLRTLSLLVLATTMALLGGCSRSLHVGTGFGVHSGYSSGYHYHVKSVTHSSYGYKRGWVHHRRYAYPRSGLYIKHRSYSYGPRYHGARHRAFHRRGPRCPY